MARTYREFDGVKVTENQWYVLDALRRHGQYDSLGGNGWVWENHSTTLRILNAVYRKGLVMTVQGTDPRTGDPRTTYYLHKH